MDTFYINTFIHNTNIHGYQISIYGSPPPYACGDHQAMARVPDVFLEGSGDCIVDKNDHNHHN